MEQYSEYESAPPGLVSNLRLVFTGIKGTTNSDWIQIGYIEMLTEDQEIVTSSSITNPGGSNPHREQPGNIIDPTTSTKWLDYEFGKNSQSELTFDFAKPVKLAEYRIQTANDCPERDPVAWTLLGQPGRSSKWILLDARTAISSRLPSSRHSFSPTFKLNFGSEAITIPATSSSSSFPWLPIESKITLPIVPIPPIAFGRLLWTQYFGEVGEEPRLPPNINEILASPCPFSPRKSVRETHLLTLIPRTVNGRPLTLDHLNELIGAPKNGGHRCGFQTFVFQEKFGHQEIFNSYWILMTKDVIQGTVGRTLAVQLGFVQNKVKGHRYLQGGGVPTLLETATSLTMQHVRSGIRTYASEFTYCQEEGSISQKTCLSFPAVGVRICIGDPSLARPRGSGLGYAWKP